MLHLFYHPESDGSRRTSARALKRLALLAAIQFAIGALAALVTYVVARLLG